MSKYELKENDFKLLEKLRVITRSIMNYYDYLIDLESQGEKDTPKYNNIKQELLTALGIERLLYQRITSAEQASEMIYFLTKYDISFETSLLLIFDRDDENMIKTRITSRLDYIMKLKEFDTLKEDEEEYYDESDKEDCEENFIEEATIQINFENDFINTVLRILNEYLNDPYYNSIYYALVEFKYLLMYAFADIELDLLDNNLDINEELKWVHPLYSGLYERSKDYLQELRDDYAVDLLDTCRNNLIGFVDRKLDVIDDIQDDDYFIDATISEIIARTCLLFLKDDTARNFIGVLESDLEEIKEKNECMVPFVKRVMDNYAKDKELPTIFSLKRG